MRVMGHRDYKYRPWTPERRARASTAARQRLSKQPPEPSEEERARKWRAENDERIRRQRIYLTTVRGPLRDAMVKRMLDRAWELLDCGRAEEADAILEFVPEAEAIALVEAFFPDMFETASA